MFVETARVRFDPSAVLCSAVQDLQTTNDEHCTPLGCGRNKGSSLQTLHPSGVPGPCANEASDWEYTRKSNVHQLSTRVS